MSADRGAADSTVKIVQLFSARQWGFLMQHVLIDSLFLVFVVIVQVLVRNKLAVGTKLCGGQVLIYFF